MHICIFQTGEPLHIDNGSYRPMRAMLLADALIKKNHKVTLISSCFFHQRKVFRSKKFTTINVKKNLIVELIPSLGYQKHIGIKRLLDHLILSFNLYRFLKKRKDFIPDRIFLGYPPIETSFVIIKWAMKLGIPVMLDVKDNWPENFIDPFPNNLKIIAKLLLYPYFNLSKYIFRKSDSITSITDSFLNWIKSSSKVSIDLFYNSKNKFFVSPLVREKIKLSKLREKLANDFWLKRNINVLERKHFSFVGSLSNSFDFNFIFDIASLTLVKYPNHKFIICGTGDRFSELSKLFKDSPNVFLFGEVNKYNSGFLLSNSIATIAPYKNTQNFRNSIPNKVIESLENRVPFITRTQGELENLIKKYKNGIFLDSKMKKFNNIVKLIEDEDYRKSLCKNAYKSYEELFDFQKVYSRIIFNIENMKKRLKTTKL